MEKYHVFYIGVMIATVLINGIQIGKGVGKALVNWMQIVGSIIVLIFYFSMQLSGGLNSPFFFWTTIYFVFYLVIEMSQLQKNGKIDFPRIVATVVALGQVIYPLGLVTGMF